MADNIIQLPADSTGKMVDTESLTVGVNTVHRQRFQFAGVAAAEIVRVTNADPVATDYGLVVRNIPDRPSGGAVTSVAAAAVSTVLLAANAARLGATIFNESAATLYLLLGAGTASTTVYTVQVPAQGYYEIPYQFAGQLTGIWTSATGNARVTELT